jgi:hypothetical protein
LRGLSARDEQVRGLRRLFLTQETRQLERQRRAHAVAEEGERLVQQRAKLARGLFDQPVHLPERLLAHAVAASGQLHRTDLDLIRKPLAPCAIRQSATARVGEAEETQRRTRLGFVIREDGDDGFPSQS